MSEQTREHKIANIQALVDFLAAHDDIPVDCFQQYNVYLSEAEELAAIARIRGGWKKVYEGGFFILRKMFGAVRLDVYTDRENVCRPVVTGTRVVEAQPAREAYEENIIEWECDHESLLAVK